MVLSSERLQACTITMALFFTLLGQFNKTYDERSAKIFMDDYAKSEQEVFTVISNNYAEDDTFTQTMLERDCNKFAFDHMKKFSWENFVDLQLRRQFEVVLLDEGYPVITTKFTNDTIVLRNITRSYKSTLPPADSTNAATQRLHHSKNWRDQLPYNAINQSLNHYLEFSRQVNHSTESEAPVYRLYEWPGPFLARVIDVWFNLRPFYEQLHGHIRRVLSAQYNTDFKDYIPDHLRQLIAEQAHHWHLPLLGEPHPDRKLPSLQTELDQSKFTAYNIYKHRGNKTGMDNHFVPQSNNRLDCEALLQTRNNATFHYCPKVSFGSLLQTHAHLAKFEYALLRNGTGKVGLNREACLGFADAIGTAAYLSASSPDYLQQELGLFKNYTFDEALNLNRLYRQAVQIFFTLPTVLVHETVWAQIINRFTSVKNINAEYWNLMRDFIGIDSPEKIENNTFNLLPQFYEGLLDEQSNPRQLFGTFAGLYIYERICEKSQVSELNRCWFKPEDMETLRKLMTPGSTKPWWHIMYEVFGKPDRDALKPKYFAPLQTWLEETNQKHYVKHGWPLSPREKFVDDDYNDYA